MVALRERTGEFIVPLAPLTHEDNTCLVKEFMRHWRCVRLSPHSLKRKLPDAATAVTTNHVEGDTVDSEGDTVDSENEAANSEVNTAASAGSTSMNTHKCDEATLAELTTSKFPWCRAMAAGYRAGKGSEDRCLGGAVPGIFVRLQLRASYLSLIHI